MKPIYKYLKLNCLVKVVCQDGAWVATSESLKMSSSDQTPDGAVEKLKQYLQEAERVFSASEKARKYEQVPEKSETKQPKEAEQESADEDSEDREEDSGDGESDSEAVGESLREKILSGSAQELRNIALSEGVEFEGLTKVPLREKLLEELGLNEDEAGV